MFKPVVSPWMLMFLSVFSSVYAEELKVGTTTSTNTSGLMDELIPAFEKASAYNIKLYAVGTGKALRMGRQAKVDVLLVHAPEAEKKFIKDGHGVERIPVMKNDFIVVGPKTDPAKINGLKNVKEAMTRIKDSGSLFISRGDDSGTHKKEMSIWSGCKIQPYGDWYFEMGAGMGGTLKTANSRDGYLLIDRGTWLASRRNVSLVLHVEGDAVLDNPYSVMAINPKTHSKVNYKGAKKFISWLTGKHGRKVISDLRVDGVQLYTVTDK